MAHELYNQLSKYIDASYRSTKDYQQEEAPSSSIPRL